MQPTKTNYIIGITASILVLAIVVFGLITVGSPNTQRMIQRDSQRVQDLFSIQSDITNYWQAKRVLPMKLSDLDDPTRGVMLPIDPQTKAQYIYSRKDDKDFQLCASFETKGDGKGYYGGKESWSHEIGKVCFDRTIDPDFYPPFEKFDKAGVSMPVPVTPAPPVPVQGETVPVR